MRAYVVAAWVTGVCCLAGAALGQTTQVDPDDLANVFKALENPSATESPRVLQTDAGFLRFVGAPPDAYFRMKSSGAKSGDAAEGAARAFLEEHAGAFGIENDKTGFTTVRVQDESPKYVVRLQQTFGGLEVFGAQSLVHVNTSTGIECVASDVMRDGSAPVGDVLTPAIGADAAREAAIAEVSSDSGIAAANLEASQPTLVVYDPGVIGVSGNSVLAWMTTVQTDLKNGVVKERVFVDAHAGTVVFQYSLVPDAKHRVVYDAAGHMYVYLIPVREEGQVPTGIKDVDNAYDYTGDTYDFYRNVHGRDSIDNKGMELESIVRIPVENAFWTGSYMVFGTDWAVDDVCGHELTHGVTEHESNLIYAYRSGAINESFSDIWGEYVDLTNGKGDDSPEVRWYHGEDLPNGAHRNMKDPTEFGDPDRVGSPYYYTGSYDNGGVHFNSGVVNKLCYLLTDGDEFNGYTVEGMGIEKTAKLFYECQTNILTPASDFEDLYMALGQASIAQGYTFNQRLNVKAATEAVEIAPEDGEELIRGFRAMPAFDKNGAPVIVLTWGNPTSAYFRRVSVVRNIGHYPQTPEDGFEIYRGRAEKALDTMVASGTEYLYALFADVTAGFPDIRYARATADTVPPSFLTQVFPDPEDRPSGFDLAFTQILFSPVGAPTGPLGEDQPEFDYGNYYASIKRNVSELPVLREDEDGAAYNVPLADDGGVYAGSGYAPIPFFGKLYDTLYLSANGFVVFDPLTSWTQYYPSLASHYDLPRISFLFADLVPTGGGDVWVRYLDDRIAATFENVPEWLADAVASTKPNTVQVELFYSGHIRITYQEINVSEAIVGLSDGQGAPASPADLFEDLRSIDVTEDFSELDSSVQALTIEPVGIQKIESGETIAFTVKTTRPQGMIVPALRATWNGPSDEPPFGDNRDGTATFRWETGANDFGVYTVRITAQSGDAAAYQDVTLWVGVTIPPPVASNLLLRTSNVVEDPSQNRAVSDDTPLYGEYRYSHMWELEYPAEFAEGATEIVWFRNNGIVPAYLGQLAVPPLATKPGERWFFMVTPKTAYGDVGVSRMSPVVTIIALPEILNVALAGDVPASVDPDDLPLANLPAAKGPATGGTSVVLLGKNLGQCTSVRFGGVEAESFHIVNDSRLEAVTPAHLPSAVAAGAPIPEIVLVNTPSGFGSMANAFAFEDTGESVLDPDVNGDGQINALDVQMVINFILQLLKSGGRPDVNRDGSVNSTDLQSVINAALHR